MLESQLHHRAAGAPSGAPGDRVGPPGRGVGCADWRSKPTTTTNVVSSLPALRLPTLILGAENDEQEPAANSSMLHSYINGSELLIYRGLGHAFPFEAPERVAEDIARFAR
ncbi:alpha/beta fold hydrolase [Nocardia gamkensis]|uniref:alpha/beta fold hydrolase n=1 Tax=Nocardia gamkensis TaxID=352869 RepID=UPI0007A464D8